MKKYIGTCLSLALMVFIIGGCQKKDRPSLGDYPKDDQVLPGGDLRFFVPFGGSNSQARFNVADSISGNPAVQNPLTLVDGVSGKALQGADGQAVKYMNANDFKSATSFTIALWMKNTDRGRTEFVFSLVDDKYGWHHSAVFLLLEHGSPTATTLKLGLMDQWMEFPDANKFQKPLLDGNWHHIAFVYDQATSKMTYYFDGSIVDNVPASAVDVKNNGAPRGALDFTTLKNVVLGGWNKQVSIAGPTDDWIKSYSGAMDQFRMYNKPLSSAEIAALYSGRQ